MGAKKNLVLGAVRGYTWERMRPFVVSLQSTDFKGDLVLLWNHLREQEATLAALKQRGVKTVNYHYRGKGAENSWSRFWPGLKILVRLMGDCSLSDSIFKLILPMQTARFFQYRAFLKAHADEYQNVLITDVRDVMFQGDPFESFGGGLHVFEESRRVPLAQETQFNAPWVEELFGRAAVDEIGESTVLCSGTIMGDMPSMLAYLGEFAGQLARARKVCTGGADQGLHNYICRKFPVKNVKVIPNGEGEVLTMAIGGDGAFTVTPDGGIQDPQGRLIPVLHQYDRHPELAARLLGRLKEGPRLESQRA